MKKLLLIPSIFLLVSCQSLFEPHEAKPVPCMLAYVDTTYVGSQVVGTTAVYDKTFWCAVPGGK